MPRGRKMVKLVELEACMISKAMEEFFRHNEVKGLAEDTQKSYRWYVGSFAQWYGEKEMEDITEETLEDYISKKLKQGNKMVSVATHMVHLRRFFRFCESRGYMESIEVMIPKYEKELKEPYTDEEMQRLLKRPVTQNWAEYRNWVMVNYFFSTGQRLSTVLNIKVADLDLIESRVKLCWNKDKRQKYMPLSTALVKILREYIDRSDLHEQDYLFPEYEGKKLQKRSAEDAIVDFNHSRGVDKTSVHLFRHTFAKNYIQNGGNPVKLQKLMNHKTIEQTMKYVNLYSSDFADDLDLFNPLDNFQKRTYKPVKRTAVVIAYYGGRDAAAIITHRVVENRVIMGEFITKGDANQTPDMNPVAYEQLIGKVDLVIPELGIAAQLLTGMEGKVAAGSLIGLAVIFHILSAILETKKGDPGK